MLKTRALSLVLAVAGVAVSVSTTPPVAAQKPTAQIVGVWKLRTLERCKVGTHECAASFGANPSGYVMISKSGVFLSQGFAEKRVTPTTAEPTDEERVALHKSMYAWGGTYKVEGSVITVNVEGSWNQTWTGTARSGGGFKMEGTTLVLSSQPFKSTIDGSLVTTRLTLERVE
ncbi:MAG TPA: lipocalin-like domain-containing protein [Hyphomicrobiaceae bacterium]